MPQGQQQWIGMVISFGVLAIVLALRMRRMSRASPLKVERLWILPAVYAAIVALLFWAHPPHGLTWLYAALALTIGLVIGWYRGKMMHITVDPETHQVSQQGSRAAMIFILVLVLARFAGRTMAAEIGSGPDIAVAATDILLASGLGFVTAQRVEMGLRARSLIAKARGEAA